LNWNLIVDETFPIPVCRFYTPLMHKKLEMTHVEKYF